MSAPIIRLVEKSPGAVHNGFITAPDHRHNIDVEWRQGYRDALTAVDGVPA